MQVTHQNYIQHKENGDNFQNIIVFLYYLNYIHTNKVKLHFLYIYIEKLDKSFL